jgi:hypothetical protein
VQLLLWISLKLILYVDMRKMWTSQKNHNNAQQSIKSLKSKSMIKANFK